MSFFFWLAGYMASSGYPLHAGASATPLWAIVCRLLAAKPLACLSGVLLAVGGAFLIHRANYMLAIIREKTLMPFFLYLLLVSSNPDFLPLNSVSPALFCLIPAFYQLLTSWHNSGSVRNAFNAAFFIGLGSLFQVHVLCLLPVFWWGMYNFKALNWRTFLASLTGAGLMYWFLLGWCVWNSVYAPLTEPFAALLKPAFPAPGNLPRPADWLYVLYVLFLTLAATVNIFLHENEENLRTRQFLYFLIILFWASFGLFLLYRQWSAGLMGLVYMPVSILLSHFFTVNAGRKMSRLYYVLFTLFIVLSLIRSPWISLLNTVI
jgi:hypothetical protein